MASSLTNGLFSKAILESGAWWDSEHCSMTTFAQARSAGKAFEQKLGVSSVAQLRSMSSATIIGANQWDLNLIQR
jgi:para-nitrobenzyl esterase